ncbi:MAG: PilW family protein [Acidimicrobiia bacterium]
MRRLITQEEGLTLTELMISLMLLAAVSAVFLPLMETSFMVTRDITNVAQANDAGRLALAQIDREFRSADRVCEPTPGTSGSVLEFRSRAPSAGAVDLTYDLDGTDLRRSADGGTTWRVVIENVVNGDATYVAQFPEVDEPVFTTEGGAGLSPSAGKVVRVRVWIDANPNDRAGPKLMTTELSGRNIWLPNAPDCP